MTLFRPRLSRRFPDLLHALPRNESGLALVEFAVTLPILLMLLISGSQLCDAVFAYRKVTMATRTIADLTAQYSTVTDGDLDMILAASEQVLVPYPLSAAQLKITQVTIDILGTAKVDWSRAKNTTASDVGTSFYIPVNYKQPGTTVVVAEVSYAYAPGFATTYVGNITLKDRIDMSPRKTTKITKT